MSDTSQGPGWWQATDGKWYAPEAAPGGYPARLGPHGGVGQVVPGNGPGVPKRRHVLRWVIVGIVALIVIAAVSSASGTHSSTTSGTASSSTAGPKPTSAAAATSPSPSPAGGHAGTTTAPPTTQASQIGRTVKDGDFAFVVNGMSCGANAAAAVNPDGVGETVPAGAQECLVTMSVTDDKGSAQTFFAENQYAFDAAGHKFSADSNGAIYVSGANDDTQVNPGITISAIVPFQIPAGDQIVSLELHDSAFSGGVTVHL